MSGQEPDVGLAADVQRQVAAQDAKAITEHEQHLAGFADALHQLHIQCGAPSRSTISKRASEAGRCPLPASSLSEVFAGKRLPKWEFLVELLRLLRPNDQQLLEEWHSRWTLAKQAERRATAVQKRRGATPAASPRPSEEESAQRLRSLEQQLRELERQLPESEVRVKEAESRVEGAEERVRAAETALKQADSLAAASGKRFRAVERALKEAEVRAERAE
ncbi:hypothetical protein, partial [Streptomyces sp. NPDC056713]|uniref:hypothetical protein n=1 Tax=Streptomyces sp. NPDC056713 TaxID=3345921 RepID=UPI0036C24C72